MSIDAPIPVAGAAGRVVSVWRDVAEILGRGDLHVRASGREEIDCR